MLPIKYKACVSSINSVHYNNNNFSIGSAYYNDNEKKNA